MAIYDRAMLVSRDDSSSIWVYELTRGRRISPLAFVGGKEIPSSVLCCGLLPAMRGRFAVKRGGYFLFELSRILFGDAPDDDFGWVNLLLIFSIRACTSFCLR